MHKIIIRAKDSKTNDIWNGATYLEAIFAFYDDGSLTLEMLKDGEWIAIEIEYKHEKSNDLLDQKIVVPPNAWDLIINKELK
jgi:hypothetical protein